MLCHWQAEPDVMHAQVMQKICRESEASLDYYSLFKAIMKRVPVPMTPLESLASSAVRTAHKVKDLLPLLRPFKERAEAWLAHHQPLGLDL